MERPPLIQPCLWAVACRVGAACKWQQGLRSTALHTYVLTLGQDKSALAPLSFHCVTQQKSARQAETCLALVDDLGARSSGGHAPIPRELSRLAVYAASYPLRPYQSSGSPEWIEQLLHVLVFTSDGVGAGTYWHEVNGEQLCALVDV